MNQQPNTCVENDAETKVALDPIDRVSEVVFGVLMAVSFSGALSVATAGPNDVRLMMIAALGCNLAWGLTDAVMFLIRVRSERHRNVALLRRLQATTERADATGIIRDALPPLLAAHTDDETAERIYVRVQKLAVPDYRLGLRDYRAAGRIFALVVIATFPVVIPFILIRDPAVGLRVSNLLALATLFLCGAALGRHTSGRILPYGLAMTCLGAALIGIILALGG